MNTVSSRLTDARQQPPTEANTLCASLWEPPRCIVGDVSQQGGVSLPGRRDLTVRAKSPGMFSFEMLRHCGSRGVLWGVVGPAGVMPLRCSNDCARGSDAHAHTHTHIRTNTHTSDLWIHSSPAGFCLCWFGIHTESSLSKMCVCVCICTHKNTS